MSIKLLTSLARIRQGRVQRRGLQHQQSSQLQLQLQQQSSQLSSLSSLQKDNRRYKKRHVEKKGGPRGGGKLQKQQRDSNYNLTTDHSITSFVMPRIDEESGGGGGGGGGSSFWLDVSSYI